MDTKIFRDLSYGVYITTTLDGQRPTGCITNSVMQDHLFPRYLGGQRQP